MNKRNGANRFDVGTTPLVNEFKVPHVGQNSLDVYVINKGQNNIGILTSKVGIGSTSEGLMDQVLVFHQDYIFSSLIKNKLQEILIR